MLDGSEVLSCLTLETGFDLDHELGFRRDFGFAHGFTLSGFLLHGLVCRLLYEGTVFILVVFMTRGPTIWCTCP